MDDSVSREVLFPGTLDCLQYKGGYRFSVDAVLLAHFLCPQQDSNILDLGAGCGVVSLILSHRHSRVHLTCLELQDSLLTLIKRNISLNNLSGRFAVIGGDLCDIAGLVGPDSYDCLVCNPPYYKKGTGCRPAFEDERAVARHEIRLELTDVLGAASFALKPGGRGAFVYPARRRQELLVGLRKHGLEPQRVQVVYSYPEACAELILVEAVKGGWQGLEELEPFYIFSERGGGYCKEMTALFET